MKEMEQKIAELINEASKREMEKYSENLER